jgi:hypothetical protein
MKVAKAKHSIRLMEELFQFEPSRAREFRHTLRPLRCLSWLAPA